MRNLKRECHGLTLGWGCVVFYAVEALHGTFLQAASTPEVQAALPAVCWNRRMLIPLGHCVTDRDLGRGIGQGDFIRKMQPLEEPHAIASNEDVVKLAISSAWQPS
jgi:hypothetical protein